MIVYFSLVTTHLLLFSCTLHRLCVRFLSRGRLLCFLCKDSFTSENTSFTLRVFKIMTKFMENEYCEKMEF